MSNSNLIFDHIHLISEDAKAAATWYEEVMGGSIAAAYELKGAPQINVRLGGMTLIIRDKRPGEVPATTRPMSDFDGYSSHDEWGTDHFGFSYRGNLREYAAELKRKGATFKVEPWEFTPGNWISYVSAPDGVSIEVVEAKG